MDGKKLQSRMKHLSEITLAKEIPQLTYAVFPGNHCPLMGAMMAVRGIADALLLVIGTDECTYYTKQSTIHNENFGGLDGRCVSLVLGQHDVTFGCKNTLYDTFEELMQEYQPKAVFLVTTCVVEVIGDDVDSMSDELSEKYGIPVLPVHTEHFKTENHLPGVRDTITACFEMMEDMPQRNTVNVIGQRLGNFPETELYRLLVQSGVEMGMMLPSGTDVAQIKQAASAKVNIIVHPIGLPLAKKMEKAFGTPYVLFDKYVSPQKIYALYQKLFDYLQVPLPEEVETLYQQALKRTEDARETLQGISYIYGNTPIDCYEYNAFMVEMGMEPKLIQTVEYPGADDANLQTILQHYDPYVVKTANIAPLQSVYDVLQPNLYLGHEYADRLQKKKIALVQSDCLSSMLGMEVCLTAIKTLTIAANHARTLQGGTV